MSGLGVGGKVFLAGALALAVGGALARASAQSRSWPGWQQTGAASISSSFGGSDIVITATGRVAGAIHSLRWRGKEFVNSYDHGRQIQSASSFDGLGECYNPTEAGSEADGTGPFTTSALLNIRVAGRTLLTESLMAYWAAPGQGSGGCPPWIGGRNLTYLSQHKLIKQVTIGVDGVPNAIDHVVTFQVPRPYGSAVFEALTAYLQPEFSQFWTFEPGTGARRPLTDGPGEQNLPIIFSTPGGDYAFGIYSAELPQPRWRGGGYGRFRFAHLPGPGNATVKWNCVFREKDIRPVGYTYRCTSILGTLGDVEKAMMELYRKRAPKVALPR
jgi:hypothetical protein